MMSQPASMLLQSISAIISVSGNVDRLDQFLRKAQFNNGRFIGRELSVLKPEQTTDLIVLDHVILDVPSLLQTPINLQIERQTIIMISGPVGSGKSTLLKVILGERAPKSGSVNVLASTIAYCSTTPWLRNVTVKHNIIADKDWDDRWYEEVIRVCDLQTDLDLLPQGNNTIVGSRGLILSGGQKHRVALARALYSRSPLLLLDDVFGALDKRTKAKVADRLFEHSRRHGLTLIFVSQDGE